MKKKYIITESQLKLLESVGDISIIFGCVLGGFWGLVMILDKKENKRKKKETERYKNSADAILDMVEKNNYKSFSVDICELKDKSVNFVELLQSRTDLPIKINEAIFKCNVWDGENKFTTSVILEGDDLRNNTSHMIELKYNFFSRSAEWVKYGRWETKLENNNLFNYITNNLDFPIGYFEYGPKEKIKTDF